MAVRVKGKERGLRKTRAKATFRLKKFSTDE
jgi:hypothetical protein